MKDALGNNIWVNDVVQITNEEHHWFPAFVTVTERKSFGIQGYYILCTNNRDEENGRAFIRLESSDFEFIGKAKITDCDEDEPTSGKSTNATTAAE